MTNSNQTDRWTSNAKSTYSSPIKDDKSDGKTQKCEGQYNRSCDNDSYITTFKYRNYPRNKKYLNAAKSGEIKNESYHKYIKET